MTVLSTLIKIFQIAPLLKALLNSIVPFILTKLLNLPKAAEKYEEVKILINDQVKQVRRAKESVMNVRNNVANRIRSLRKNHHDDDYQYEPEENVNIKNSESVTSAVKHIITSGASSMLPSRESKNNLILRNDKARLPQSERQSEESE